tara:strand:- start:361 stop:1332 length:972 start_codon:yes stop_codon:yes gene_type:complete
MDKKEFTKKQLRSQLTILTESKGDIKSELKKAYKALKSLKTLLVGHKTGEDTLSFSDLKKIKTAARHIEDIYEDMVDEDMSEEEKKKARDVEKKNEQSEGHGEMYNAFKGIKEGKVIKMTQSTLKRIVERVINEQQWPPKPTYEQTQDLKQIKACVNTIQGYEYTTEGRSPYVGGTFMTEFMWHLSKSFDKDAENAKEIEYKIKKCFRNTVFWDEYGKALRFLGDDRKFRQEMKRLERGTIKGDNLNEQKAPWDFSWEGIKNIPKYWENQAKQLKKDLEKAIVKVYKAKTEKELEKEKETISEFMERLQDMLDKKQQEIESSK